MLSPVHKHPTICIRTCTAPVGVSGVVVPSVVALPFVSRLFFPHIFAFVIQRIENFLHSRVVCFSAEICSENNHTVKNAQLRARASLLPPSNMAPEPSSVWAFAQLATASRSRHRVPRISTCTSNVCLSHGNESTSVVTRVVNNAAALHKLRAKMRKADGPKGIYGELARK